MCNLFSGNGFVFFYYIFKLMLLLGRSWKACELRLKSWDDLHKLWYVLLKDKNMLMTQRQMLNAQNLRFPNPERIPKVLLHFFSLVLCCTNVALGLFLPLVMPTFGIEKSQKWCFYFLFMNSVLYRFD